LFVPSITTVFPVGGADLSGVVMLIVVGAVKYGLSAAVAAAVEAEPDAVVPAAFEAEVVDELEELEEPQAASARASTKAPTIGRSPRRCGRPPVRRLSLEW
jgi:hypothetical protein